nr:hypothetical protein [Tanacetum cinerariifolium]
LSVIIIPLIEDLIVASSIGNLSHIRKWKTHEVVKGRPAKTPLEVLCLLLRSTISCSEEPSKSEETLHKLRTSLSIRLHSSQVGIVTGGGFPPESDGPKLVRNSSRISARIYGSKVCKAF